MLKAEEEQMAKTCLKCGATQAFVGEPPSDAACFRCGAIYTKVEAHHAKLTRQGHDAETLDRAADSLADAIESAAAAIEPVPRSFVAGELEELPNILWADEVVEMLIVGIYEKRHCLIVASDKRVIVLHKGIVAGTTVQDFLYEKLTTVSHKSGALTGTLLFGVSGHSTEITGVQQSLVQRFADHVRARMSGIASRLVPSGQLRTGETGREQHVVKPVQDTRVSNPRALLAPMEARTRVSAKSSDRESLFDDPREPRREEFIGDVETTKRTQQMSGFVGLAILALVGFGVVKGCNALFASKEGVAVSTEPVGNSEQDRCWRRGESFAVVYLANVNAAAEVGLLASRVMDEGCAREGAGSCEQACRGGFQFQVRRATGK
jgi:Bacterial PH domain